MEETRRAKVQLSEVIITHRAADGSVISEEVCPNRLFDSGEDILLKEAYRAVASFPVAWFGRLAGGAPVDTAAIGDITGEPLPSITTGYMPIAWSRGTLHWGAPTALGQDRVCIGSKFSFGPAKTAWTNITVFFFGTLSDNTATLYARFQMTSRTVSVGETLDVTPIGVIRGVTS